MGGLLTLVVSLVSRACRDGLEEGRLFTSPDFIGRSTENGSEDGLADISISSVDLKDPEGAPK